MHSRIDDRGTPGAAASASHRAIRAAVARIPSGRVATYGQIAALAGLPSHARLVGYALAALPDDSRLPWHRVVNAAGRVSPRSGESPMALVQRALLEREGVVFDARGRIALARFRWKPKERALPPWGRRRPARRPR